MHIVYCRLEVLDGNTKDFNFESKAKLNQIDYNLVRRAYLYMLYYFSTTTEMSDRDLETYDLYSPPFIKSVFILKVNDKFLKLNYLDSPLSYQLSDFYPETGDSNIISSKPREIYSKLVNDFNINLWKDYKLIHELSKSDFSNKIEDEENSLSLVSSYGDDYTTDNEESNKIDEENSLSLGSSSVSYEEEFSNDKILSSSFDEYSIKERRTLLEEYKLNLKDAIEIKEIRTSIIDIDKRLKYYSNIKKEIENFNIIINKKDKERDKFKDIHWMSLNLYKQMNLYVNKKKKYDGDLIAYKEKLEKNKKDVKSIIPDNIFKNKIFTPTFLIAIITFILSWTMRDKFWFLSGASILFFTISFYYLWGYIDYLDYIIKLRREKVFYEKKLIHIEKKFNKEFSNLEIILKKENIKDINIPIARYDELKEFDIQLEKIKEKLQTYIAQKFSEDTQQKFDNLIKEKEILNNKLKSYKNLKLNYKEIEYNIIELKKSIKNYEKDELDEFSLDDEITSDEKKTQLDLKINHELAYKYNLSKLKSYFEELKLYFTEDISLIYENLKNDFFDIMDFSINYKFSIDINFSTNKFIFMSEKEIDWNQAEDERFKFFLQYSLIKYLSKQNTFTIFIDLQKINEDYNVLFSSYIDDLSDCQVIYTG